MSKITFTNKVDSLINSASAINKIVAADMNEIKTSVNALYDLNDLRQFTYAQLLSAISGSTLVAGDKIVLTDFATKHYMLDGSGDVILNGVTPVTNTGITEPLILTVLDTNTVSNIVESALYPQDILHYDWNGENWKLDLAFGGSFGVVLTGWKGVIYFRHDTINDVSMGHDFRHVLNRRWKRNDPIYNIGTTYSLGNRAQDSTGLYESIQNANTGNALSNVSFWLQIINFEITAYVCRSLGLALNANNFIDVTCFYSQQVNPESQYNLEVESVHLGPIKDDTARYVFIATILQNNVFALKPNYGYHQVYGISAKSNCTNNTFLGEIYYNNLESVFAGNIIGNNFRQNIVSHNFSNNVINQNFKNNIIGSDAFLNTIKSNFQNNLLGASINSVNFITATHVYQTYNCNLLVAQGGAKKLTYINNVGAQVIVDATA